MGKSVVKNEWLIVILVGVLIVLLFGISISNFVEYSPRERANSERGLVSEGDLIEPGSIYSQMLEHQKLGWWVVLSESSVLDKRLEMEESGGVSESVLDDQRAKVIREQDDFERRLKSVAPSVKVEGRIDFLKNVVFLSEDGMSENVVEELKNSQDFPEIVRMAQFKPVFPMLLDAIPKVNSDDLWEITDEYGNGLTGVGITIGILDTGVDYNHPDLGNGCFDQPECKVIDGWTVGGGYNGDPFDTIAHGTGVASIIAGDGDWDGDGVTEPDEGLDGVAPDAKLIVFQVCEELPGVGFCIPNPGSYSLAIDAASSNENIDILHLSLGGPPNNEVSFDLISGLANSAVDAGKIVVAVSGNSGPDCFDYDPINCLCRDSHLDLVCQTFYPDGYHDSICTPGIAEKVITVASASLPDYENVNTWNSRGPVYLNDFGNCVIRQKPDLVAPGEGICAGRSLENHISDESCTESNYEGPWYAQGDGSSWAAPVVSGIIAQILQVRPELTNQQIKNYLMMNAVDLGLDSDIQGVGRIDALEIYTLQACFLDEGIF